MIQQATERPTLYAFQERRDVSGYNNQSLSQLFGQSPLEHQVQHVVHVFRHAWSKSRSQHRYTLEDGLLVGRILLATNVAENVSR
jgi:hypothetical protein